MELSELIATIIVTHRTLDDLMRAHQRIDLQIKAIERGMKDADVFEMLHRQRTIDILDAMRQVAKIPMRQQQRELARLAALLPVHAWQAQVRGFGEVGLARIIAECGDLSNYASPAKVWKRMGVAVIEGERQRKVTGDAALKHGYVPRRSAIMYNIGESLLKTNDGAYRETYLRRKAIEQEAHPEWATEKKLDPKTGKSVSRHPKHYHNRARRYMTKLLLKHLWQAWRDAGEIVLAPDALPAADIDQEIDLWDSLSADEADA